MGLEGMSSKRETWGVGERDVIRGMGVVDSSYSHVIIWGVSYYIIHTLWSHVYPHTGSSNPRVHSREPMITTSRPSATDTLVIP